MSDLQEYTCSRDLNGDTIQASLRPDGSWKLLGYPTKKPGLYVQLGGRRRYHDYSF